MAHKQTDSSSIKKQITFDPVLYQLAKNQAKSIGLSLAEYIRHLLVKAIEERGNHIPMVDEETNKRIGNSLSDLESGKYVDVDPSNEAGLNKILGL